MSPDFAPILQQAAYRNTWKNAKFTKSGRSFLHISGKKVGWQTFGAAVKGVGHVIGFATAISTGADIGTWVYAYYSAHEKYYENGR